MFSLPQVCVNICQYPVDLRLIYSKLNWSTTQRRRGLKQCCLFIKDSINLLPLGER